MNSWNGTGQGPPPLFVTIENDEEGNPPSWYPIWILYLKALWKLEAEEPLSEYMYSFDGFRDNYSLLTEHNGACLPPKKYLPDQERLVPPPPMVFKAGPPKPKAPEKPLRERLRQTPTPSSILENLKASKTNANAAAPTTAQPIANVQNQTPVNFNPIVLK